MLASLESMLPVIFLVLGCIYLLVLNAQYAVDAEVKKLKIAKLKRDLHLTTMTLEFYAQEKIDGGLSARCTLSKLPQAMEPE